MRRDDFRDRVMSGAVLSGTFVKTPAHEVIEVLATSGLDFLCLDAEHAAFDRARLDLCLAVGRARDVPMLVRVASSAPQDILQALDSGADGIVVPHVDTAGVAATVARAARFGPGGRGFAGSTRWAGFATRTMADILADTDQTLVFVQIEDPQAVAEADAIAATEGVDGLFLGPADLSVALGITDPADPGLARATAEVGAAARRHGRACMTFVGDAATAHPLKQLGYTMFFVASEHSWMRAGAAAAARAIRDPD